MGNKMLTDVEGEIARGVKRGRQDSFSSLEDACDRHPDHHNTEIILMCGCGKGQSLVYYVYVHLRVVKLFFLLLPHSHSTAQYSTVK